MQENLLQPVTKEINATTLFSCLTDWFDRNDWNYDQDGDAEESWVVTRVSGDNCKFRLIAMANEELRQVYFWAEPYMTVPADRRLAVAEFITRANYGKRIGYFEMDWRDGEIRSNVSIEVADGELTDTQIERVVSVVLNRMDLHFVALMSVIYGGREPVVALDAMRERVAETAVNAEEATGTIH